MKHAQAVISPEVLSAARCLWNFLKLDQPLQKSDCLIALGSHDLRVADYAAHLMLESWAPLMVCSGGLGRLTQGEWNEPEAVKFARVARRAGVASDRILLERHSSNTGENIRFTQALLQEKGISVQSAILVHKPYMERRAFATACNYWPEVDFFATSPPISFEAYPNPDISLETVIEALAGDFWRVQTYAQKGFQIHQEIPPQANSAFQILQATGFTRFTRVE